MPSVVLDWFTSRLSCDVVGVHRMTALDNEEVNHFNADEGIKKIPKAPSEQTRIHKSNIPHLQTMNVTEYGRNLHGDVCCTCGKTMETLDEQSCESLSRVRHCSIISVLPGTIGLVMLSWRQQNSHGHRKQVEWLRYLMVMTFALGLSQHDRMWAS